jgi:hypothetical protein
MLVRKCEYISVAAESEMILRVMTSDCVLGVGFARADLGFSEAKKSVGLVYFGGGCREGVGGDGTGAATGSGPGIEDAEDAGVPIDALWYW